MIFPLGKILAPTFSKSRGSKLTRYCSIAIWGLLICAVIGFVIWDARREKIRLVSGAGIFGFVFLGYLFSAHRTAINWRQVSLGFGLQIAFGFIVLRWPPGQEIIRCFADKVAIFLAFTDSGTSFVFGYLASGKMNENVADQIPIFAFKVSLK